MKEPPIIRRGGELKPYAFGNRFLYSLEGGCPITFLYEQELAYSFLNASENVLSIAKKDYGGVDHLEHELQLVGITVEYLAKLTDLKGHLLVVDYKPNEKVVVAIISPNGENVHQGERTSRFFLKVAVKEGYICKSLTNL